MVIGYIIFLIFFITYLIIFLKNFQKKIEKIDNVKTIDGIRYLVSNTDVSYVMYKLGSTIYSKIVEETSFEKINDYEGIFTFCALHYDMIIGKETSKNSYRIKCTQHNADVIMDISFEKSSSLLILEDSPTYLIINQAYHRFFKEIFDVKVI